MTGESYRQRQRKLDTGGSITGEKEVRQQNTPDKRGYVADHRPGKPTRPLTGVRMLGSGMEVHTYLDPVTEDPRHPTGL